MLWLEGAPCPGALLRGHRSIGEGAHCGLPRGQGQCPIRPLSPPHPPHSTQRPGCWHQHAITCQETAQEGRLPATRAGVPVTPPPPPQPPPPPKSPEFHAQVSLLPNLGSSCTDGFTTGVFPRIRSYEPCLTRCVCPSYKSLKNNPAGGPAGHWSDQGTQCASGWIHSAATSVRQLRGTRLARCWVTDKEQVPRCARLSHRALRGGRVTSGCAWAPGRSVPVGSGRVSAASGPGGAGWVCWLCMACLGHVYV